MDDDTTSDDTMTLDPPGSIAVVGAGPIGVEAALYGRFLGYDVTVLEAVAVGHSMSERQDEPFPMLPNRCMSPLAISALQAQRHADELDEMADPDSSRGKVLPMTYRQWIHDALIPLTETDLLRGRVRFPLRVKDIQLVPVESGDEGDDTSEIPADFRLTGTDSAGHADSIVAEAVIVAVGGGSDIRLGFSPPIPYFYRIGAAPSDDPERDLASGLREIVAVFAALAGRADLDLYRPRRV